MDIYLWCFMLIATFLAELATPSALVSVWFFFGSLVALLVALMRLALWIQITLFLIVSFACLLMMRPLAKKIMRGNTEATNIDRFIGHRFLLREGIDEEKDGLILINDIPWKAQSACSEIIEAGKHVEVLSFSGSKVIVRCIDK